MTDAKHRTVFDTDQQHLGTVYAKALLGATEKAGNTEAVLSELHSVNADVLARLPQLKATLASPRVPLEAKLSVLDRAFGNQMTPTLLDFLKVLCRRGRFDCLAAIESSMRRLFNDLRGRVEVEVRSAEPLDDATIEMTANRLRAALQCDVELRLETDPDILGGLVIRIGDTVYDGSIANRLHRLRDDMVASVTRQMRGQVDRFALAE